MPTIYINSQVAESIADYCFPNEPLYDERTDTFEILEYENFNTKEDIIQTILNADSVRHSEGWGRGSITREIVISAIDKTLRL